MGSLAEHQGNQTNTTITDAMQKDIKNLTYDQLAQWLEKEGLAPYRTGQVLRWIYQVQSEDFFEMTNISKDLRARLAKDFYIGRLEATQKERSGDGTEKFVFTCQDGQRIETVLIPERGHQTLCVSTQAGCAQGCGFCRTGQTGLFRNLTTSEIVAQVRDVEHMIEEPQSLTNLVFMGMGEPLANYRNLKRALDVLTDNDWGMRYSGRRVTVSTAGLAPVIPRLGEDTRVKLAVSLNAADDLTRDKIMPINKKYPIESLLAACRQFPLRPGRRITFEYVLLAGVNDKELDARRLAKLLAPFPAKINLIAYNPFPGSEFDRPLEDDVLRFKDILFKKNFTVIIRKSKGADISAACGQLSGESPQS